MAASFKDHLLIYKTLFNFILIFSIFINNGNSAKLTVPRILLPYNTGVPTNYTLEVKGGCYKWSSNRYDLVLVTPLPSEHERVTCTAKAVVSAVSRYPERDNAIVLAEDEKSGQVLRCDVVIDSLHSIEVVTTTRVLFLEDAPEVFEVVAKNGQGDTFSSLAGVAFHWSLESDSYATDAYGVLRFLKFADSVYKAPPSAEYWEKQHLYGSLILIEGSKTGSAKVIVKPLDPAYKHIAMYEVSLVIVANLNLKPAYIYLLPGTKVKYHLELIKQGKAFPILLPSDQYYLEVADPATAVLDTETSTVTAIKYGSTNIVVKDRYITGKEIAYLLSAVIHVTVPSYLTLSVSPGDKCSLKDNKDYSVSVQVYDRNGHPIHITRMPLYVMGLAEQENLFTFGTTLPASQFKWTVSKDKVTLYNLYSPIGKNSLSQRSTSTFLKRNSLDITGIPPENNSVEDKHSVTEVPREVEQTSYNLNTVIIFTVVCTVLIICIIIVYYINVQEKTPNPNSNAISLETFDIRSFQTTEIILKGTYGNIVKGSLNDQDVAIKIFSSKNYPYFLNELFIYKQPFMNHASLLKLIGTEKRSDSDGQPEWLLITVYAPNGCIEQFLGKTTISWQLFKMMTINIFSGLAHLHQEIRKEGMLKMCVIHRNLTPQNILVNSDGSCLLSNFVHSVCASGTKSFMHGMVQLAGPRYLMDADSLRYIAPECLEGEINLSDLQMSLKQADVYSLALITWELATRCRELYPDTVPEYTGAFVLEAGPNPELQKIILLVSRNKIRPEFPPVWQKKDPVVELLINTIEECWEHEPAARLTADCALARLTDIPVLQNYYRASTSRKVVSETIPRSFHVLPMSSKNPEINDGAVFTSAEATAVRRSEQSKGGLKFELVLSEPALDSPKLPAQSPPKSNLSIEDIEKKPEAADKQFLELQKLNFVTEEPSHLNEVKEKKEEFNHNFKQTAKENLEQKLESMKENRDSHIKTIQEKAMEIKVDEKCKADSPDKEEKLQAITEQQRESHLNSLQDRLKDHEKDIEVTTKEIEEQNANLQRNLKKLQISQAKKKCTLEEIAKLKTHVLRVRQMNELNQQDASKLQQIQKRLDSVEQKRSI